MCDSMLYYFLNVWNKSYLKYNKKIICSVYVYANPGNRSQKKTWRYAVWIKSMKKKMEFSLKTSFASSTILLTLFVSTKCQRHFLSQRQPAVGLSQNAATSALPTKPRDSPGSPSKRLEKGSLFNFALDLWSLEIGRTKFLAQCPGFLVASLDKGGMTDVFLQIRENCIPTSSCVLCLRRSPETVPTQR